MLKAVLHPLAMNRESKVYTRPKSDASPRSHAPSRPGSALTSFARFDFFKVRFVYVFMLVACGVDAQTYNLGQDTAKVHQSQASQTQSPGQPLGWGSNIQNARLARAAQLALQQGNHALALDYAQRAAQAAPNDPQLWFLLGYAARLSGKYPQSADAYDRGLRLTPSAIDGLSGLAQTYSLMGRVDDAERLLKQAIASDPRRSEDALLLGDLYMRSADYTAALDWLGKAERSQPGARSELLMALCYQHMKQMDLASQYLELAKRHAPDNPDVQRTMAGYYREAGNYSEAIAALKSIRKPKPDVLAELGYTFQLDGKLDDSARQYELAASAAPKDLGLQLSAAQAEVAIGSIDKANSVLHRAEAIDADYYRLHAIRGEIAKLQEREPEAVSEYTAALAKLPANPAEGELYGIQLHLDLMEIYRNLAQDSAAHNQLRIAQSEISAINDPVSTGAQFLRLRALIKMDADDPNGALTDIKAALAINAHDHDDLQLNGDILVKLGRFDDAIAVYKQVLAIDSVNQFALTSLGYASRAAGRDQDAEAFFQRLAQADPKLFIPYLALGDLYTARRDFPRAAASYAKAYALAPRRALIVAAALTQQSKRMTWRSPRHG